MGKSTNPDSSPMNGQHLWLSGIECCVYGKDGGAVFNEFCAVPVFRGAIEGESPSLAAYPTPKDLNGFSRGLMPYQMAAIYPNVERRSSSTHSWAVAQP